MKTKLQSALSSALWFAALGLGGALTACASPDIPGEEESDGAGKTETGSPAAKLPGSTTETPKDAPADAPANTPTNTPTNTLPGMPPVATCDLTRSFAAPLEVTGLPVGLSFATPRLSRDELTLYVTTRSGDTSRISKVVRPSLVAPFGAPTVLDAQSSTGTNDNDPTVSADGATLWFSSERIGGRDRLFMAPWMAATNTFGAPQPAPASITSSAEDKHPYYRVTGGGELWFVSNRGGQQDIYVAKKTMAGFDAPLRVDELRSAYASRQPMVTEDGLTVVYSTERAGGLGGKDLWTARRATVTVPFGAPEPITAVNSAREENAGWISNDGCRLYFSSDRLITDVQRVFVAARPAK